MHRFAWICIETVTINWCSEKKRMRGVDWTKGEVIV